MIYQYLSFLPGILSISAGQLFFRVATDVPQVETRHAANNTKLGTQRTTTNINHSVSITDHTVKSNYSNIDQ